MIGLWAFLAFVVAAGIFTWVFDSNRESVIDYGMETPRKRSL